MTILAQCPYCEEIQGPLSFDLNWALLNDYCRHCGRQVNSAFLSLCGNIGCTTWTSKWVMVKEKYSLVRTFPFFEKRTETLGIYKT